MTHSLSSNRDQIRVLKMGHYHCAECGAHLKEQDARMDPPSVSEAVFWCENSKCPNYRQGFVAVAEEVECDAVDVVAFVQ